jgi:hypothetical protein
MKRSIAKSPLVETPNKWLHTSEFVWQYGDYKCCLLTVIKTEEGKYKPLVNGSNNIQIENWRYNHPETIIFNTLEEAKNYTFKYMDAMRAREDAEFKKISESLKNYAHVPTTTS